MKTFYKNKRVLVTGACGTVGKELIEMLLTDFRVGELVALDNNETALFLQAEKYKHYTERTPRFFPKFGKLIKHLRSLISRSFKQKDNNENIPVDEGKVLPKQT